jgi:hypothetical protein
MRMVGGMFNTPRSASDAPKRRDLMAASGVKHGADVLCGRNNAWVESEPVGERGL